MCAALVLTGCSFRLHATAADDAGRDAARDGSAGPVVDAAPGSPALAQQAIASANNSNAPVIATLAAKPIAGDLLIMIGGDSGGTLMSVSGGGVATWTRATRSLMNVNIEVWYGLTDGSSAAVTIMYMPHNDPIWELVTDWSGMASTNVLDASASTAGTSSPAGAGSAGVTPRELTLFAAADLTPNTFGTPTQGAWTALMPASTSTTVQQVWYVVAATTGTLAPTVSESAHSWDAAIASFHPAP